MHLKTPTPLGRKNHKTLTPLEEKTPTKVAKAHEHSLHTQKKMPFYAFQVRLPPLSRISLFLLGTGWMDGLGNYAYVSETRVCF